MSVKKSLCPLTQEKKTSEGEEDKMTRPDVERQSQLSRRGR